MDELVKIEIQKGLQKIIDRFTGDTKTKVAQVVSDINFILGEMVTDPEISDIHKSNLHLLYANLSTIAAIEEKELRKTISNIVVSVLNKFTTALILSL